MSGLPENKIEQFECQRCTACCRQPGYVYLKNGEAERIAGFLQTGVYDFTEKYCDVQDRRFLVLKKEADETCIFLKENACIIHDVKPEQCGGFPRKWRTERSWEYCLGLVKLLEKEKQSS